MELSTNLIGFTDMIPSSVEHSYHVFSLHKWNPIGIIFGCVLWVFFRRILPQKNAGRILSLLHAIAMISMGIPGLLTLGKKSFQYSLMLMSLKENFLQLSYICNLASYISVSFFIVDSFTIHQQYLKHHIGAVLAWLLAAYHLDCSLVHGVVIIFLFETGALLVQLSRVFPNNLFFRTSICCGYTLSRIAICWYVAFIMYHSAMEYPTSSVISVSINLGIILMLLLLVVLNIKWTMMQWKLLISLYIQYARNSPPSVTVVCSSQHSAPNQSSTPTPTPIDFFTAHQIIIGNSPVSSSVDLTKLQA